MKRTFAAIVTMVLASTSVWLATGPAYAKPKPPAQDTATMQVVPKWTYQGGKLAVMVRCAYPNDYRVVSSKMLPGAVNLRFHPHLLIEVTNKTKPGKYAIALWCVTKQGLVDALGMVWVNIRERLPHFRQPAAPPLPRHFKPNVTVKSGPPAAKKR